MYQFFLAWNSCITTIRQFLPASEIFVISKALADCKIVLDIGCGQGETMRSINKRKKMFAVGVDIYAPYLRMAKKEAIHDEYVLCDACFLPFRNKSFDATLCLEVIEHLKKEDGLRLFESVEAIARRVTIFSTPAVYFETPMFHGNPFQLHRSVYTVDEFKSRGYAVSCRGIDPLLRRKNSPTNKALKYLSSFLTLLFYPLIQRSPNLAHRFICVKYLDETR